MLTFYDNFALSQSNTMLSVACNSYCNSLLIAGFMKYSPHPTPRKLVNEYRFNLTLLKIWIVQCASISTQIAIWKYMTKWTLGSENNPVGGGGD